MEFKTNAKCEGCSSKIIAGLKSQFPNAEWSLDLDTADKILHCHGLPENAETAASVVKAIEATGFRGSWIES